MNALDYAAAEVGLPIGSSRAALTKKIADMDESARGHAYTVAVAHLGATDLTGEEWKGYETLIEVIGEAERVGEASEARATAEANSVGVRPSYSVSHLLGAEPCEERLRGPPDSTLHEAMGAELLGERLSCLACGTRQ